MNVLYYANDVQKVVQHGASQSLSWILHDADFRLSHTRAGTQRHAQNISQSFESGFYSFISYLNS